jgi:hypothetical protein
MAETFNHFDGAALWASLSADQQAAIGSAALEYVAGANATEAEGMSVEQTPRSRVAEESLSRATDALEDAVNGTLAPDAWLDEAGHHRIPSVVGQICRQCGCTEHDGCYVGCGWAEENLCTACVARVAS